MSTPPNGPQYPQYPQYPEYPPNHPDEPAKAETSTESGRSDGFGITALVLGIVALVLSWVPVVGIILAVLAIIFGAIGLAQSHKVMSGFGVGLGGASVLVFIIIVVNLSGSSEQSAQSEPSTATAPTDANSNSTQQSEDTSEPTTQPQQPTVVLDENHSGAESTSNFTVSGKYTFEYSFDCNGRSFFALEIANAESRMTVAMPVSTIGASGSDTLSKRVPALTSGPFYVKSSMSGCDWSVKITDLPG